MYYSTLYLFSIMIFFSFFSGQLMSLEGELDKVEIRDKEKGQTKPGE